ncbi:hypothetical protein ACT7DN_32195 [Bacillus paranthracis]
MKFFWGLLAIKVIVGFATLFFIIIITGRTSIYQLNPVSLVFVLVLGDFLGNNIYEDKVGFFSFFICHRIVDVSYVGNRVYDSKK